MPKKTKREKIVAQYRKRIKLLEQLGLNTPAKEGSVEEIVEVRKEPTEEASKSEYVEIKNVDTHPDSKLKKYFASDFKKSIFLVAAIIALEIVLYFGTIYR